MSILRTILPSPTFSQLPDGLDNMAIRDVNTPLDFARDTCSALRLAEPTHERICGPYFQSPTLTPPSPCTRASGFTGTPLDFNSGSFARDTCWRPTASGAFSFILSLSLSLSLISEKHKLNTTPSRVVEAYREDHRRAPQQFPGVLWFLVQQIPVRQSNEGLPLQRSLSHAPRRFKHLHAECQRQWTYLDATWYTTSNTLLYGNPLSHAPRRFQHLPNGGCAGGWGLEFRV